MIPGIILYLKKALKCCKSEVSSFISSRDRIIAKIMYFSKYIGEDEKFAKKLQPAYLFTTLFHLVFSITKKTNKYYSGEFLSGCHLYFILEKKIKSPKISWQFWYISITKIGISMIFFYFEDFMKCFYASKLTFFYIFTCLPVTVIKS